MPDTGDRSPHVTDTACNPTSRLPGATGRMVSCPGHFFDLQERGHLRESPITTRRNRRYHISTTCFWLHPTSTLPKACFPPPPTRSCSFSARVNTRFEELIILNEYVHKPVRVPGVVVATYGEQIKLPLSKERCKHRLRYKREQHICHAPAYTQEHLTMVPVASECGRKCRGNVHNDTEREDCSVLCQHVNAQHTSVSKVAAFSFSSSSLLFVCQ